MSAGNVPDVTRAEDLMCWLDTEDGRHLLDTHPDRAALILASAQVHATLALVEQQRIANIIAISGNNPPEAIAKLVREAVWLS